MEVILGLKTSLRQALTGNAIQPFMVGIWHRYKWLLQRIYFVLVHRRVKVLKKGGVPERGSDFRSQFGQDVLVNGLLQRARGGKFLDVGANHPESVSNTFFFERELGWSGVAIEPLPDKAALWQECRPNTEFVSVFASDCAGAVEFLRVAGPDGWEDMMSTSVGMATAEQLSRPHRKIVVPSATIDSILAERGIEAVDFVSIDVEGAEMVVLGGFDLAQYRPKIIVLENASWIVGSEAVRRYLRQRKYVFFARIWTTDDVYLSFEAFTELTDQGSISIHRRERSDAE